jgi:hypothetical protein
MWLLRLSWGAEDAWSEPRRIAALSRSCCAVVCCGVLWCAVVWCLVLCCAMLLRCAVLCCYTVLIALKVVFWCGVVCCYVALVALIVLVCAVSRYAVLWACSVLSAGLC